ncbi:MAG TPA: hypothetical protein VFA07_07280 [Chthonomonadaceae bacterium]|nr:hypothetical protein [Chthonomonadaceae bacterium]
MTNTITPQEEQAIGEQTFDQHKQSLMQTAYGQYVLIKMNKIVGTYPSQKEAILEGLKIFQGQSFLVRHLVEEEEPITLPSIFSVTPL